MKKKFNREKIMKRFTRRHTAEYGVVQNGAVIQFVREYSFLSNFYPVSVVVNNVVFPSVENAYQAMKFRKYMWYEFVDIMPGEAKRLAIYMAKLLDDSGSYEDNKHYYDFVITKKKIMVMKELLLKKFNNDEMRDKLLKTNGLKLVEGNVWNDIFWGVDLRSPDNSKLGFVGKNYLGKLLMEVRNELIN